MTVGEFLETDHFIKNLMYLSRVDRERTRRLLTELHGDSLNDDTESRYSYYRDFADAFLPELNEDLPTLIAGLNVRGKRLEFPRSGRTLVSIWDSRFEVYPDGTPASVWHVVLDDGKVFDTGFHEPLPLYDWFRRLSSRAVELNLRFKILKVTYFNEVKATNG